MSIILSKAGAAEFDVIYEDMKKQFPYVEIKAKNTFLEIAKTSSYDIWLAQSHIKGKTHDIGYMLVWQDKEMNFIWLEYIAVSQKYHGKGYGSKMLKALKAKYLGARGCFLEVEKPSPLNKNSERRLRFYTEKGAYKLDFRYYFPMATKDLELDLYFLPFKRDIKQIPNADILKSIINIYAVIHRDLPSALKTLSKIRPLNFNRY